MSQDRDNPRQKPADNRNILDLSPKQAESLVNIKGDRLGAVIFEIIITTAQKGADVYKFCFTEQEVLKGANIISLMQDEAAILTFLDAIEMHIGVDMRDISRKDIVSLEILCKVLDDFGMGKMSTDIVEKYIDVRRSVLHAYDCVVNTGVEVAAASEAAANQNKRSRPVIPDQPRKQPRHLDDDGDNKMSHDPEILELRSIKWGDAIDNSADEKRLSELLNSLTEKIKTATVSDTVTIPKGLDQAMPLLHKVFELGVKRLGYNLKESDTEVSVSRMLHGACFSMEQDQLNRAVGELTAGTAAAKAIRHLLDMIHEMSEMKPHDYSKRFTSVGRAFVRRLVLIKYQTYFFDDQAKRFDSMVRYSESTETSIQSHLQMIFPTQKSVGEEIISAIRSYVDCCIEHFSKVLEEKKEESKEWAENIKNVICTYAKDRKAQVVSCLTKVTKQKLTKAGKLRRKRIGKNFKARSTDLEPRVSHLRPSIETNRMIISPDEKILVKNVNSALQKIEHHLPQARGDLFTIRLVETRSKITKHIELLHQCCKAITQTLSQRKGIAYSAVLDARSENNIDHQTPHSTAEWNSVIANLHLSYGFGSLQDTVNSVFSSVPYILAVVNSVE
jgi:hypothetical protein